MHFHRCGALEELSLEDNRIVKLENLSSLRRLTKLDLGKNRITRVAPDPHTAPTDPPSVRPVHSAPH